MAVSPEPPPRPEQTGCEAHQVRRPTRSHPTQGSGQLTPCCRRPAPAHPPAPAPTAAPSVPTLSLTCRRARGFGTLRVCVEDCYLGTSGQTPTRVWKGPSTGVRVRRTGFQLQTRHQQPLFPLLSRDNGTCHGMGAPKEHSRSRVQKAR